jgi:hypothetical protein
MSDILKGNRAVKVPASILNEDEAMALYSKETFTFYNMLGFCEQHLKEIASAKNIDLLEYQALFDFKCKKYEKLYFSALRSKMREKIYFDQIKEFSSNYSDGIFHPYNPFLQKYNGAYLRNYQLFD